MKIEINVKNSSVSFKNQIIDLSASGVYLVTGQNGAGKTTILKDIVFQRRFNDPNRNHFAYAEQDPEKFDISVNGYLYRFNNGVSSSVIGELLEELDLGYLDLNCSIMEISGGELVKLNIIAALIKDRDFVFLDEPTNNLDDEAVERLANVLSKYSERRAVVVVSHDPRLACIKHHSITVAKGSVEVEYLADAIPLEDKKASGGKIAFPWRKIMLRHFIRPFSIVNLVLMLVYAGLFIFVNHMAYLFFFDAEEYANRDGSVLIYSVDNEYGELGQLLTKSEKINIDEDNYYSMVKYESVPSLVSQYRLENVFILDETDTQRVFTSEDGLVSAPIISVPQIVQGYSHQIFPVVNLEYLSEGRYPYDRCGEIVTSQHILDLLFPDCKIGDTVLMNETEYVLVGIHFRDVFIISYDDGEIDGNFYRYDSETYDAFVARQIEYKTECDAPIELIYRPVSLVLQASISSERSVLLAVFSQYPANNYRSYSYDKDISDYRNNKLITLLTLINIGFGILFGLVFVMINKRRVALSEVEAASIDNYYLTAHLAEKWFGWGDILLTGLIWAIYLIVASKIATFSKESMVMAIGFGAMCLVSSVQYLNVLRRRD